MTDTTRIVRIARPGDTLVVGGPGATRQFNHLLAGYGYKQGDEVRVFETRFNGSEVRVSSDGYFWSIERFSLPVEEPRPFRVGDTVRVIKPTLGSDRLIKDSVHEVSAVHVSCGQQVLALDGRTSRDHSWFANRFELVQEAQPEPEVSEVMIGKPGEVIFVEPHRSYDFNAGDRRFYDTDQAVAHAFAEFNRTGVAQIVRDETSLPHFADPMVVVQAVRS